MNRRVMALTIPFAAFALAACSQIDALAPVGGAAITTVRNATYDVLVEKDVDILVAPQCTTVSSGFTCKGTTVDGDAIIEEAGPEAPYELTIAVGTEVIFEGSAQAVLQDAVLEAS